MKRYPLNDIEPLSDMRHLLTRSSRLFSDKAAFAELSRSGEVCEVSYARFLDDVRALGTALLARGYAGKRIALIGENSYAWLLAYFAIVNSGIVVAPFDRELSRDETVSQMERSAVDALCHTALYAQEARDAADALERRTGRRVDLIDVGSLTGDGLAPALLPLGRAEVARGNDRYAQVELDRAAVCSILFTSGTTGTSKGVMLSHRSLTANIKGACELVLFHPDDTLVSVLPVHHAYEDMAGIFCPIFFGCTIALCPSPKAFPRYLATFRPTVLCFVPLYVETFQGKIMRAVRESGRERSFALARGVSALMRRLGVDVSGRLLAEPRAAFGGRLRLIVCGGAALDPSYASFYRSLGVNLLKGYGVSECSPIIAVNRNDDYKDDAVGPILSCAEVRFDEGGQLWVRGDLVMVGYLDEADGGLTDGWFATGDIGYLDDEGFLHITGRCKDVIVLSNGKNVMPQEIELALTSCDSIAEAVVVAGPEEGGGPAYLVAHVVPDLDALGAGGDTAARVSSSVEERVRADVRRVNRGLVYHKRIASFAIHDQPFEKTTTRKVKRYLLEGDMEGMRHV